VCAINMSPNPNPLPVQANFPHKDKILFMHDFNEKVEDVDGDGHCEFYVVAGLCDMSHDNYQIIRLELLRELTSDRHLRIVGTPNRFNQVKHALTHDGIGPCTSK
jgi:hypothetical protein